jgi:hypothetical protein
MVGAVGRSNLQQLMYASGGKADLVRTRRDVANDPDVWSGRASQVDFEELAVSGLASMYPAFDWSVFRS